MHKMASYKVFKTPSKVVKTEENIQQIPIYADTGGIYYSGYAKKKISSTEYILKRQDTRFYSIGWTNGITLAGTYTFFSRPNFRTHRFYATGVLIQYSTAAANDIFVTWYDGNTNNGRLQILMLPSMKESFYMDLSACPRPFEQENILINFLNGWTGEANFTFFGFDEEI